MGHDPRLNEAALRIHTMDREQCIEELLHFRGIPLDFNAAYLSQMSSDRLRHVLLAAVITVHTRKAG